MDFELQILKIFFLSLFWEKIRLQCACHNDELLPNENYIFFGDSKYNPYGTKTKEEITERCIQICNDLISLDVKAIVIACNTATSACVNLLREMYDIPIIGMEPALKVACQKGSHQKIVVWATDFTLKEKKFVDLMSLFEQDHQIHKIPCPKLVRLVEENEIHNQNLINETLKSKFKPTAFTFKCPSKENTNDSISTVR